jgi:acetyl esterase/lipase
MPIGYFVTVALVTSCTALALRPISRPRPLARLSFALGMVVSELPHVAFLLLLASTLLAIGQDGLLGTTGGWALAGVAGLTALGLAALARRALAARGVVQAAVSGGLRVYRPGVPIEAPKFRLRPRVWLRVLLAPYPFRPRRIERIANVSYGNAGKRNRLDVYRHRSRPPRAPALLYFHGGGYFSGNKNREGRALLHRLAGHGWVCVSATYRLRPAAGFPDHLVDAKKAIAWVRRHGREYGAGPDTLVVAGSSAGAHLASLAALTPNDPILQPGFEDADTTIDAAICLYGYYGRYYERGNDERLPSTPLAYDALHAPPFFVAHGDRDTYVPVEGARMFVEHLREASPEPVVYAELPGGQHAFDRFHSARNEAVVDGIETFLDQAQMHRHLSGRMGQRR